MNHSADRYVCMHGMWSVSRRGRPIQKLFFDFNFDDI